MARIPYVELDDHPELKGLVAEIMAGRGGRISPLYGVLLNSPPVAAGWLHFLTALRKHTVVPSIYRELVILHVAVLNGAQYEYEGHVPLALQAGINQRQRMSWQTGGSRLCMTPTCAQFLNTARL